MYFKNKCSEQSARCPGMTGMAALPSQAGKQPGHQEHGPAPHLSITERAGAEISLQQC